MGQSWRSYGTIGPMEAPVQRSVPQTDTTYRLDYAIREHLRRVLFLCAGNTSEAARRLGIHRRSLQRMLPKLGITAQDAAAAPPMWRSRAERTKRPECWCGEPSAYQSGLCLTHGEKR